MKNTHSTIVFFAILMVQLPLFSKVVCSEENTAASKDIPTGWISDGAFLGPRWWIKNPLKLDVVPDPLLYHTELQYSYSETKGNIESSRHKGKALLFLRKKLLTSLTAYEINRNDAHIALTDANISTDDEKFFQVLRYALTPQISLAARFAWSQDSKKYIQERTMIFAGLKYHAINTAKYDLFLGGFYGPETNTSYMSDIIQSKKKYSDFQDVEEYSSDAVYIGEQFHWQINDILSLSQDFVYVNFLKDTDFYSLDFSTKLDVKISKSTSLFVSYDVNYDNNSFVKSMQEYLDNKRTQGLPSGDMETTDTSMQFGIKFMF